MWRTKSSITRPAQSQGLRPYTNDTSSSRNKRKRWTDGLLTLPTLWLRRRVSCLQGFEDWREALRQKANASLCAADRGGRAQSTDSGWGPPQWIPPPQEAKSRSMDRTAIDAARTEYTRARESLAVVATTNDFPALEKHWA